jgi:hypothetical protein
MISAAASVMPFVCDRDERNRGVVVAGVIRMALMRVTSWTNYLFFTS